MSGIRNVILLAAVISIIICPSQIEAQKNEREEFSIVLLPDTQYYSFNYNDVFYAQTKWIADNIKERNIKMVVHVGDVTENNTPSEWAVADKALVMLDGKVPYSLALGNHDYPENASSRDTDMYNKTFTLERYQMSPGWGGRMGTDNDNHYRTFSAAGMDFLVLTLEFGPTDEMLEWANNVAKAHPDHRIIVNTHCYMGCDGTRVGNQDPGRPQSYGTGGNDGEQMWEKFVKHHENIFMVLSGHLTCGGEGQGLLVEKGTKGNRVIQILCDYQNRPYGGSGWLKIIQFIPEKNHIVFTAYSPYLDRYDDAVRHTFYVNYDMTVNK